MKESQAEHQRGMQAFIDSLAVNFTKLRETLIKKEHELSYYKTKFLQVSQRLPGLLQHMSELKSQHQTLRTETVNELMNFKSTVQTDFSTKVERSKEFLRARAET